MEKEKALQRERERLQRIEWERVEREKAEATVHLAWCCSMRSDSRAATYRPECLHFRVLRPRSV